MQKNDFKFFKNELLKLQKYVNDGSKGYMIFPMVDKYYKEEEACVLNEVFYDNQQNEFILKTSKKDTEEKPAMSLDLFILMTEISEEKNSKILIETPDNSEKFEIKHIYARATKDRKNGILFVKLKTGEEKQIIFNI